MIEKYKDIYEKNKQLDQKFINLYNHSLLVKKNKLELLVEIGEFANETRCFKYWSKKSIDFDKVGYELADTIIMSLCFFNYLNLDLDSISMYKVSENNVDLFLEIYDLANRFIKDENKKELIKMFILLINVGYNLGFNDDKIVYYCSSKIEKDLRRIK